jgi:hypothetical protein
LAGAEGCVTRVTDEPLFLLRMDTDIALARLASGRTVPIGVSGILKLRSNGQAEMIV